MAASLLKSSVFCTGFHLKNLIGVAEDAEYHVLITCRGVVKRYNTVDRRQVRSWITKSWLPFTSPAIYHPTTHSITAVINTTSLIQWTHQTEAIDSVKKINFETDIHQLVVKEDEVYVLFTTGHVEDIVTAINTRKEPKPGFLKAGESIRYVHILQEAAYLVMVVERPNNEYVLCKVHLGSSSALVSQHPLIGCAHLTGICVLSTARLITLWSTGDIYTFDLENDDPDRLPGELHEVENQMDVTRNTKILELSPWHIVIIGLDKQDGGGLMVLRDIKFGMVTHLRKLKMYVDPPMGWVTVHGVVVAEGSSLTLVPFTVQEPNLANVFGSKVSETVGSSGEVCHSWLSTTSDDIVPAAAHRTVFWNTSSELCKVIQLINRGALSQSLLAREVITHLVEKRSIVLIDEAMRKFTDVPESSLIDAMNLYLQCEDKEFCGVKEVPNLVKKLRPLTKHKASCPFITERAHFINGILQKPFTDDQLINDLHRISFSDALELIQYLEYLIASGMCGWSKRSVQDESGRELSTPDQMPSLCQVAQWLGLILDVNYHQLIMSSEFSVHNLLLSCFEHTTEMRNFLEDLQELEPLVQRVVEQQPLARKSLPSLPYSLERMVVT